MSGKDLAAYLESRLQEAEDELAGFKAAIANHGLRIREQDDQGERDVTDRHLKGLEAQVEEYRTLARKWSSS